jgi:hypothetical protein
MKKYFKILLKVLILNFLLINPINSKTLPPGTGGEADVPANVLILLDASGSMSNRIQVGVNYRNDVLAVAPVTNTDLVLVYAQQRIRQVNQASNTQENIHASRAELNHTWNRFSLMDNEKKVVYYNNLIFTYDNRDRYLYRYDFNNNQMTRLQQINETISHMFLNGNNLILISHARANYFVKDLSSINTNATRCQPNRNSTMDRILRLGQFWRHPQFTFNVDASGNLIAVGSEDRRTQAQLYKFASSGTCFESEPSNTYTINSVSAIHTPSSVVGHPTNPNQLNFLRHLH